jgi:FMN-dependent NADH-azoreductase
MKLLHIDSSITGANSISRQVSAEVVRAWGAQDPSLQVAYRDLERERLPHLDSRLLGAALAGWSSEDAAIGPEVASSAAMLQEFLDADVVVIGAPMYNFAISSQLKAWIDRLLIAGKTFRYTEAGPVGLAGGKKVIVVSSRGGLYTPGMPNEALDFQERYLRAALGFMGIDDVEVVRAEGVAFGPEQRQAALDAALAHAPRTAAQPLSMAAA